MIIEYKRINPNCDDDIDDDYNEVESEDLETHLDGVDALREESENSNNNSNISDDAVDGIEITPEQQREKERNKYKLIQAFWNYQQSKKPWRPRKIEENTVYNGMIGHYENWIDLTPAVFKKWNHPDELDIDVLDINRKSVLYSTLGFTIRDQG
ncbi:hypothetical protein BDA99DRAFT_568696 [Phascolomyces articulosus]|uniref:Uncharacterized protein n=1 Tax=Phascolomyces articulosus TaxID=60185 RepID=A0AAD5KJZ6_9FUNG|nr:hypothetical protein BDA99DRAFT_568696 [Phascolomyces articulosus]